MGPHFSVWLSGLGAERERERGKKGSSPLSGQRALKWKDDQREKNRDQDERWRNENPFLLHFPAFLTLLIPLAIQNFLGPQADVCLGGMLVPKVGKSSALLMSGAYRDQNAQVNTHIVVLRVLKLLKVPQFTILIHYTFCKNSYISSLISTM